MRKAKPAASANPAQLTVTLPNSQTVIVDFPPEEIAALTRRAAALEVSVNYLVSTIFTYRLSESPTLPACPFCHRGDLLEVIQWTAELSDVTGSSGPVVRCNRCHVIAAADAWLLLCTVRNETSKHA